MKVELLFTGAMLVMLPFFTPISNAQDRITYTVIKVMTGFDPYWDGDFAYIGEPKECEGTLIITNDKLIESTCEGTYVHENFKWRTSKSTDNTASETRYEIKGQLQAKDFINENGLHVFQYTYFYDGNLNRIKYLVEEPEIIELNKF